MAKQTAAQKRAAAEAAKQKSNQPQQKDQPGEPLFEQAVGFVLKDEIEGGYVNDPRDPGGETNFGIAKKYHPKVNIKNLTRAGAVAIYKAQYWDPINGDDLPPKLAVAAFDCAVNQGVSIARKMIQRAAGVTADGVIGPVTLAAVQKADQDALVLELLGWRLRRYAFTNNSATFMRGWANRILHLQAFILQELEVA